MSIKDKPSKKVGPFFKKREQQNDEIAELKAQLEEERTKMKKLLEEQEHHNEQNEKVIRQLGDKFKRVQQGLSRMEKERRIFKGNQEKAEKENQHLRRLLLIRDRELQALNLKIAKGETVPGEYGPASPERPNIPSKIHIGTDSVDEIVSVNMSIPESQISKMMTNLEVQLSLRDEHVDKLVEELKTLKDNTQECMDVQLKLRQKESEQSLLKNQVARMVADHDQVMDVLSNCFAKIQQMTRIYKRNELERTEIIWEANRCLLEQRQAHLQTCSKMAKELYRLNQYVEKLGGNKENRNYTKPVALETIVLDNSRASAFAHKDKEHERQLQALRNENEERVLELVGEYSKKLEELNQQMIEKDRLISSLIDERAHYDPDMLRSPHDDLDNVTHDFLDNDMLLSSLDYPDGEDEKTPIE